MMFRISMTILCLTTLHFSAASAAQPSAADVKQANVEFAIGGVCSLAARQMEANARKVGDAKGEAKYKSTALDLIQLQMRAGKVLGYSTAAIQAYDKNLDDEYFKENAAAMKAKKRLPAVENIEMCQKNGFVPR